MNKFRDTKLYLMAMHVLMSSFWYIAIVILSQKKTNIVSGHLGFFRIGHIEMPQYFKLTWWFYSSMFYVILLDSLAKKT